MKKILTDMYDSFIYEIKDTLKEINNTWAENANRASPDECVKTLKTKLNNLIGDIQMTDLVANIVENVNTKVGNDKPVPATVWINVGFVHPTMKDKNGNPIRCTLPLGIPLDTIKDGRYNLGAPESVVTAIECGNQLKATLLSLADTMQAGECKELPQLQVFIQKCRDSSVDNKTVASSAQAVVANLFK